MILSGVNTTDGSSPSVYNCLFLTLCLGLVKRESDFSPHQRSPELPLAPMSEEALKC